MNLLIYTLLKSINVLNFFQHNFNYCKCSKFFFIASKRDQLQLEVRFKVLQLLNDNPEISTRQIANKKDISNGGAYYCLKVLIKKGLIKLGNFPASGYKDRYAYILTPQGIREKSLLTARFLKQKMLEYKELKLEIAKLQKENELRKKSRYPNKQNPKKLI